VHLHHVLLSFVNGKISCESFSSSLSHVINARKSCDGVFELSLLIGKPLVLSREFGCLFIGILLFAGL
jgi:hypothetical protein